MPYDVDRSLLPQRRWAEGLDRGRNYASKLGLTAMALVPGILGVVMLAEETSYTRIAVALPLTLFSLAMLWVARSTRWVWPERAPTLHAHLTKTSSPGGAGVCLPGRTPTLLTTFLLASAFAVGGAVMTTLAVRHRGVLDSSELRYSAGFGVAMGLLGVWLCARVAIVAGRPSRLSLTLTPDGVVVCSPVTDRRLRWDDLQAVTLTEAPTGHLLEIAASGPYAWWDLRKQRPRDELDHLLTEGEQTAIPLEMMSDHPSVIAYAVRYYQTHPEDRGELLDARALDRLRSVIDGPTYADD